MFGIEGVFTRILRNTLRKEAQFFRQYVGDDTILVGTRDDMFIYLDGRDASLTPCILRSGTWEPHVAAWLDSSLRPGDCFVDIGANNGIHALRAGRKVGSTGRVIVFEPQERLADLIERSASANLMIYNCHVRRMALGAQEGSIRIGKFAHLTGSATVTPNQLVIDHVDVPLMTLPGALEQLGAEIGATCIPDVIKIDVEGFEYDVWQGLKDWTRDRERLAIILEFSPVSYRHLGQDARGLLRDFEAYEFALFALKPNGTILPLTDHACDAMAAGDIQYDVVLTKNWTV